LFFFLIIKQENAKLTKKIAKNCKKNPIMFTSFDTNTLSIRKLQHEKNSNTSSTTTTIQKQPSISSSLTTNQQQHNNNNYTNSLLLLFTRALSDPQYPESLLRDMVIQNPIPDHLRGAIWAKLCHYNYNIISSPNDEITENEKIQLRIETESAIEKDLERTFPRHVLFESSRGRRELCSVLLDYADFDYRVGYCQGMAFIAAFALSYQPPLLAQHCLKTIMIEFNLRSLLMPGMPLFKPALEEITRLIEILCPELFQTFETLGVEPTIFASQWLLTLFSYNFPFHFVARVWDLFFASTRRWEIIVRVVIALLSHFKHELETARDFESIVDILKSIPKREFSTDQVINTALRLNVAECDVRVL
jgi:hypothetical protein